MNAPVIIGFVRGEDYVIELANEGLLEVWGRNADVIGRPLVEAIPEFKEQANSTAGSGSWDGGAVLCL
jgi:hypothetical protein